VRFNRTEGIVISLGKGVLTWNAAERRTDRYGTVYLVPEGVNSFTREPTPSIMVRQARAVGMGSLIAVVTETRDSTHIGDLFRRIYPRTPDVGTRIKLGDGELFFETAPDGGLAVGLRPTDGRATDWLIPRALYDAHEQSVELLFEPKEA
jgi:hypothetical protein